MIKLKSVKIVKLRENLFRLDEHILSLNESINSKKDKCKLCSLSYNKCLVRYEGNSELCLCFILKSLSKRYFRSVNSYVRILSPNESLFMKSMHKSLT